MTALFDPIALRGVTLKNRLVVAPMCTYAAHADGKANDWHLVHYGRLAMGGAAMVMLEATAVEARGRGAYSDLGLWDDEHIAPLRRVVDFLKSQDSVPAIQLQHAGRKAAMRRPWHGGKPLDDEDARLRGEPPWVSVGPSALPYADGAPVPHQVDGADMQQIIQAYVSATRRSRDAGFEIVEIHGAHGYLMNQFLSPIANQRTDRYGGSLQNRMRFCLEVAQAVRAAWPLDKPLFWRVSAVDGVEGGWTMDETVVLSRALKERGVDVIDCSSGGIGGSVMLSRIPRGPGFQVPFAERIRREAGVASMAVGLITTAQQAAEVVDEHRADLVAIGRELLIDPNWPLRAQHALNPEGGYGHWPEYPGWWLQARERSLAASR